MTEEFLHYDYVRLAWDIGFNFEDVDVKNAFDLNVIGLVDVDKVARDRDIPTVVKHIPTLLSFQLDDEIGKVLEPNFIKLFKLSQLSIQYLKFCKKYLDNTVALLKNELATLQEEKEELEGYLEEVKFDYESIKRKYHELQATLSTSVYKCEQCAKTFYSEEYLLAHIKRRHENLHQGNQTQVQNESDKLQLEIKELKQRLNNTEKLIQHEHEKETENEKEQEHIEPNNDAVVFEDSIQFKFEQLKNHIETEINSLKDEDFYRGIYEKFIKERVERKLSVHTVQVPSDSVLDVVDLGKDIAIEISAKAVESATQTECSTSCVSEGTSMSPQPTPRRTKPHEDGDHESIRGSTSTNKTDSGVSMKNIEEKLAREVELQRETLEQILDLKLSGSLNKMEAQMNAFWEKLNAWESTIARPVVVKSTSDSNINNTHVVTKAPTIVEPLEPKASPRLHFQLQKQRSTGSIQMSPTNKCKPRALPRQFGVSARSDKPPSTNVSPIRVMTKSAPPVKIITSVKDAPARFDVSDSSEEDTATSEKTEDKTSESEEEKPSNIKPSASFRKRLDETLMLRLKPQVSGVPGPDGPQMVKSVKPSTTNDIKQGSSSPVHLQQLASHGHKKKVDEDGDNGSGSTVSYFSDSSDSRKYQDMKNRLKRHVEESVNQKMKDIGVSPHWKGLPDKSYKKAIEIVEHQANLSKKNIHDFYKIRKNIERAIDKEIDNKREIEPEQLQNTKRHHKKQTANEKLENLEPIPPQSDSHIREVSSRDSEIPLQRTTARPIIKPKKTLNKNLSPQSSISSHIQPSPITQVNNQLKLKQEIPTLRKVEVVSSSLEVIPTSAPVTNNIAVGTVAATSALAATKKKVLFNLDSDSDVQTPAPSPHSPLKKMSSYESYVKQEKSKLEGLKSQQNQTEKQYHKSGSESSDWDISDIT